MNFFDAELLSEGGKYAVLVQGYQVELGEEQQKLLSAKGAAAQKITLGVRPPHIALAKAGEESIKATVDVSEMMGSEVHLHVNAGGKDVVIIVPTLDLGGASYSYGSELQFTFSGEVCHVFDAEGKNLEF